MPRAKPITDRELLAIKESVNAAWREKWLALTAVKDFRKLLRQSAKLSPANQLQQRMLFSLRYMPKRLLSEEPISEVITQALVENDLPFFVALGKVLSDPPIQAGAFPLEQGQVPSLTKLEQSLLSHWATAKDGFPELFYLTPEGLAAVCNHALKTEHITPEAVVKLRQRLGLKPFKRQKISVLSVGKTLRFPQLDK